MEKHKWNIENKCEKCGLIRKLETHKLLMAVVNHPPWNAYKYDRKYAYSFNDKSWTFLRPDCKKPTELF